MTREDLLARTLVQLADNLVEDFDVVDLLTLLVDRCVRVLDVSAAGLILAGPDGHARVVASSSEAMRLLEILQLQAEDGPCFDCLHTGRPVAAPSIEEAVDRWPRFAPEALAAGFVAANALPMRLRGTVIGAINLLRTERGSLGAEDTAIAQAFADVATIAILQHRAATEARLLNEQLHHALQSRIAIEQAKGVVAERAGIDMAEAFERLRAHARNENRRLSDVASDVVAGSLTDLGGGRTP